MQPKGSGPPGRRVAKAFTGSFGQLSGLGIQFAATIGAFGLLGYWLDGRLGTRPWLLGVGVFVGATAGFVYMVRTVFPRKSGPPASGEGDPR